MTDKVSIEGGAPLSPHPLRAAVLGEVHARPFTPIEAPIRVLHFAFDTSADAGQADRAAFGDFCVRHAVAPPRDGAKQHRAEVFSAVLRWEQHSEFTTYTWELRSGSAPFDPPASALAAPMRGLPQPGPLLVALDLHLIADTRAHFARYFDHASLAVAENSDGDALFATDFQTDASGFVRILVLDRGMTSERAGHWCSG